MKTTNSLLNKRAQDIVNKIMCLDPITIEWIKHLMKQWSEEIPFADAWKVCKDIKKILIDGKIADEQTKFSASFDVIFIHGRAVWIRDIVDLLEKT